jgi:protein-disulfide isomerase
LERLIQQVLDRHPDDVKYVVKHFPLTSHRFAHKGSMAALAANNQGKYWEFHGKLLENHNRLNDEKILEIATALELDMERFQSDLDSQASRRLIQEDVTHGRESGVEGTPTVYMNGKKIKNRKLGSLMKLVEEELAKLH